MKVYHDKIMEYFEDEENKRLAKLEECSPNWDVQIELSLLYKIQANIKQIIAEEYQKMQEKANADNI